MERDHSPSGGKPSGKNKSYKTAKSTSVIRLELARAEEAGEDNDEGELSKNEVEKPPQLVNDANTSAIQDTDGSEIDENREKYLLVKIMEREAKAYIYFENFLTFRREQKLGISNPTSSKYSVDDETEAYFEWKQGAFQSTNEEVKRDTNKAFNNLLLQLGKTKVSVHDNSSTEALIRLLKAHGANDFSATQLRAIYDIMFADKCKSSIYTTLLDICRTDNLENLTTSDRKLYQKWLELDWCSCASISQLTTFLEFFYLPRLIPSADNEKSMEERFQGTADNIVKTMCNPSFTQGKGNESSHSATSTVQNLFKALDIEPLKSALDNKETSNHFMDKLFYALEFRDKKGENTAKSFMNEWRGKNIVDTTFANLASLKMAILDYLGRLRVTIASAADMLNIEKTDMATIMAKLAIPKVRNDVMYGTTSSNPNRNVADKNNNNGARNDPKGKNPAPWSAKPSDDTKTRKEVCIACGTTTAKHGVDADKCPYKKQKHPNANYEKTSWALSKAGIAAKEKKLDQLVWETTIDGVKFPMTSNYKGGNEPRSHYQSDGGKRPTPGNQGGYGESHELVHIIHGLAELEGVKSSPYPTTIQPKSKTINPFLNTRLINLQNREGRQATKDVKTVLVDTGAIDSNYISSRLTRVLEKSFSVKRMSDVREVKTPDRSAPKFYTEGSVNLEIEIYDELENKVIAIQIKALIIDSPIDLIIGLPTIRDNNLLLKCTNQILWGTREKWVTDKQVTPAQFRKADAAMLNSIVDSILIESKEQSNETNVQANQPTAGETLTNCIACHTLVSKEECARHAKTRQQRGGSGEAFSPCIHRQAETPQHCPDPSEFPKMKPFEIVPKGCFSLCLLCSNAEIRHLDRLRNESNEFFSTILDTSEVLDDTRQMLYQLQAKIHCEIAETQREMSDQEVDTGSGKTVSPKDENPMKVGEYPQESAIHNKLDGLQAAISSTGYPTTRDKLPTPHIQPLQGIKPGDRIPMGRLLQSDESEETEFEWINDPDDDPTYASKDWIEKSEEWKECATHGSESLQREIRTLLRKYKSVFSSRLPIVPARVIPLAFTIDETKWKLPCNREPPRRQSLTKDAEIRDMIRDMIQSGVVSTSKADAWSQVLLTAKPNGKWRFCIDYRQLNKLIENRGWPLPRIQELITRVGNSKPKVFGKMDLTNGYHQMPLAKESRKYTAFRSANGLYESNRVPMGLKNAGAYFQQAMADEVVGEILYNGTELYIDDILVHGQTDKEFLKRLEIILKRCMDKGIVLSPKKCAFGMEETEILGHTLNDKGSTFSKEKLQGVLDFKLPSTTVQLQSFLGLVNYFRDHVKNVAELERPLREMLKASKGKHTQLHWSESDKNTFDVLKNAVWNCPRLYFWQPHLPVNLHTDACDTGIGAYLFQVDEKGNELPIGFLSRALKGAELNWSTFEQEGYAIHQALKKFEYLLRDVKFTLRTDHRNLLYMNMKASDKVLRWKLDIQQFDFDVEHIPGPDNIVADLYSRLCSVQTNDCNETVDEEQIEEIQKQMEPNRPSSMLAALHNRFKPAPATRIERPLDANVYNWLKQCHGHDSLHGHGGVEATLSLLKAKVPPAKYWTGMRKDVRNFIQQCPCCQFMQSSKSLIATTAPYNVSVRAPMDRLNIDTIGPFPPDEHGNTYIIVIIDVFSRFVELYAAPDATALSAAKAVVQWIGRYGNPGEILTDNGTQYTADVITQLCDLIRVEHLTILPYSHEENAIVERANREVNRHLRAIVFDKKVKNDWSLFLPLVQRIMNASVSASTGVTPASIIFGNAVDLDKGLLPEAANRAAAYEEGKPLNDYLCKLLRNQAHIIALAQTTQYTINQEHMRRKTNQGNQVTGYDINDYVIYEHPTSLLTGDSRPDKLAMHYRGPYRIISIDGSRITIQNLVNTQSTVAHISQLRPFLYDPIYINPVEIARNAGEEFEIDSIVAVRGKRDRKQRLLRTDLEVKVHWLGYSHRYNTWEPFSEMKLNETFQLYCWDNNLRYLLIPEALTRLST
jgi:transposase InsO family protein